MLSFNLVREGRASKPALLEAEEGGGEYGEVEMHFP